MAYRMSTGHKSITEKILLDHALEVEDGFVLAEIDLVMGHDATTSLLIDKFLDMGAGIWDVSRIMLVADHFMPPCNTEHANILSKFLDFADNIPGLTVKKGEGICHQLLAEDQRVVPGALIAGADSHTVTIGALGCVAIGLGSTDILRIFINGRMWFRIPQSIRVDIIGKLYPEVTGRDVALKLLAELGEDGAIYHSIEIYDHAGLSMDHRFALCNAVVEAGAKNGIIAVDEITIDYLEMRGFKTYKNVQADNDVEYVKTLTLDLSELEPLTALPHSPCNVRTVNELKGLKINRAFIGSCAGGRLSDLKAAAEVFSDDHIHPSVQLMVIPASKKILAQAMKKDYIQTLIRAGAVIAHPCCGACGGISNGILADGDVCVSNSTRNYQGRMGHPGANVYLASSRTVALSALHGRLAG